MGHHRAADSTTHSVRPHEYGIDLTGRAVEHSCADHGIVESGKVPMLGNGFDEIIRDLAAGPFGQLLFGVVLRTLRENCGIADTPRGNRVFTLSFADDKFHFFCWRTLDSTRVRFFRTVQCRPAPAPLRIPPPLTWSTQFGGKNTPGARPIGRWLPD